MANGHNLSGVAGVDLTRHVRSFFERRAGFVQSTWDAPNPANGRSDRDFADDPARFLHANGSAVQRAQAWRRVKEGRRAGAKALSGGTTLPRAGNSSRAAS